MADDIQVRQARPGDGPALMQAIEHINNETEFLGVPGEGHPWDGKFEEELSRLEEKGSGAMFLAFDRGAIVGYLSAFAGWYERNRGTFFIAVIGLREPHRGRGIGTRLFEAIEDWARARGAWRLDLRVSSLNRRGQALYRKRGFEVEGTIRQGVLRDGAWTDDFWMAKLLDPGARAVSPIETPRPSGRHAIHTLVVREMRPGDGAAFRDWDMRISAAVPYHAFKLPGEAPSVEAIERDIADAHGDPRIWLVAVQQDVYGPEAVIALGTASIERRFRMNHDAFVNVAILPEWAGQGLGRRLHRRVEDWAREHGARRLTAATHAPNLSGRHFAAALGYQEEVVMRGYSRFDGRLVDRIKLGKLLVR